jgi:hypothetical protein
MPRKVWVTSPRVCWPQVCACCLCPADDSYKAPSATGEDPAHDHGWEVPYCQECLAHLRQGQRVGPTPRWINITVVALFIALVYFSWSYGSWISFGLLTVTLALGAAAANSLWQRRREEAESLAAAMCHPECAAAGPAVVHRGWNGSAHTFECSNPDFAEALAQANRKKTKVMSALQ